MTTVRKTEPDDYSTFRGWLTTTENVISYTGTDFSWEDFDDSDNPEMSATVARHIRSHTMVDDRGTALGLVVAYPNFDYPWVWTSKCSLIQLKGRPGAAQNCFASRSMTYSTTPSAPSWKELSQKTTTPLSRLSRSSGMSSGASTDISNGRNRLT